MINLYVISDSTGETANQLANAIAIQFKQANFSRKRFSNIVEAEQVEKILGTIDRNNSENKTIVLMTVVAEAVVEKIKSYENENLLVVDLLLRPITEMENFLGIKADRQIGLMRDLDNSYFDKIEAIEFAMNFDDGKNPKGFLEADIVLLGVSRTSKTPLSVYLANKSYKVANLPLVPEIAIPKEIYEVERKKIIGLIINPEKLNEIRNQRLVTLGLSPQSSYASDERIQEELKYAKDLYEELGCTVIDVSSSTIEETAARVIEQIEN